MDKTPQELYDEAYAELLGEATAMYLAGEDATAAYKNLKTFSECRPLTAEPRPEPTPVPTTKAGRFAARAGRVLDNETTRAFIKAGGAFAGVAAVVYSTIHKDHVLERQALAQANQNAPH